ncbi:MAG: GNAT family N-acetyltransferase [Roseovarius sp.]
MIAEQITLRPARLHDLATLTDISLRAKAHWGYDDAFMEACRDELTVTAADLSTSTYHVAEQGGALIGLCALNAPEMGANSCELHSLFVAPEAMGQGVGQLLMGWAIEEAKRRGATLIRLDADSFAEGFYTKMGAICVGRVPSGSIPGRSLPLMELALGPAQPSSRR